MAFTEDELAWLYVDEKQMRRSIGSSPVQFALAQMAAELSLEVLCGNAPAIALYEKHGFHIEETVHGVTPGNEFFSVAVHVMRRMKQNHNGG